MRGKEHIVAIILSVLVISSMIMYAMAQQLFITTDKPTYTADEKVIISGYGPANSILVMMVYLANKTLYLEQLSLGDAGNFTITLPALGLINPGVYTVWIAGRAYSKGELIGETTTSFVYIVPGIESNTTTPTNTISNTTNTTITPTVTLTETITETQTTTVTETLVKTRTITDTTTVTRNITITKTETQTTTQTQITTKTTTQTETVTQTRTETQTMTKTTTETQTTTQTTTLFKTVTETQIVTAQAPLAEKIVYLVVGLFVGIAITYAMRVLTAKQQ